MPPAPDEQNTAHPPVTSAPVPAKNRRELLISPSILVGAIILVAAGMVAYNAGLFRVATLGATVPGTTTATSTQNNCFVVKNGKVYDSYGFPLQGADPATFAVVTPRSNTVGGEENVCYAKDGSHVWFDLRNASAVQVVGADPATFHALPYVASIAADANHVYVESAPVEGADAATFTVLSKGFAKDKNYVYAINDFGDNNSGRGDLGGQGGSPLFRIPGADPATFAALNDNYGKDKNGIWYNDGGRAELFGADPATFQALGYGWGKDKNNVYDGTTTEPVSDPASFTIVTSSTYLDPRGVPGVWYTKDKNRVYDYAYDSQYNTWGLVALPNADPATFTTLQAYDYGLSGGAISVDKNAVYLDNGYGQISTISGVDPSTFSVIGNSNYERDKNSIYYQGATTTIADPSSFQALDTNCGRDANSFFAGDKPLLSWPAGTSVSYLPEAQILIIGNTVYSASICAGLTTSKPTPLPLDASTLKVVGNGYLEDKNGEYYLDNSSTLHRLTGKRSDLRLVIPRGLGSAVSEAPNFATDGTTVYVNGVSILEADPNTFEPVAFGGNVASFLAKDARRVYFITADNKTSVSILSNLDPKSTTVLGPADLLEDKNGVYTYDGRKVAAVRDPASFLMLHLYYDASLQWGYAKDNTAVYYFGSPNGGFVDSPVVLQAADPSSFTVLDDSFAKDKNHVYTFNGPEGTVNGSANGMPVIVPGADPATFVVTYDPANGEFDPHDQYRHYGDFIPNRSE